ncbi:MAG: hypothetical protein IKB72_00120 [Ruminococcus sp.]|nr:hypothetical protein [Oscillospiraceae bacterium]MBR2723844.1 hypothetical protein [Ruminococcus sp.]
MKKLITFLMALVLCLSLCACGNDSKSNEDSTKAPVNQNTVVETQAPTTEAPAESAAQTIQVGETISLDYATLTLDSFEISDGYEFEYVDTSSGIKITHKSSIDCPSGMKLVCLKGKFTNKSTNEVYPSNNPVHGKMVIDGYEYKTELDCYVVAEAESVMGVAPLREVDYFLYAEVPDTLANNISNCQLYIGFVENLETGWLDDVTDCDALYLLEATPTTK